MPNRDASADKRPTSVRSMFGAVAPNYDRMNSLLSLGMEKRWRRVTRRAIDRCPSSGFVLDAATGTATSARALARPGRTVVGCDFTPEMLAGSSPDTRQTVPLVAGDCLKLPFPSGTFDVVTVSFGIRNMESTTGALLELRRVTKRHGSLVICEFSQPTSLVWRALYAVHMRVVAPVVARVASSNPSAYRYLSKSISEWPGGPAFAAIVDSAGWSDCSWEPYAGGIVAVHTARAG